jgi:hypothetical protein
MTFFLVCCRSLHEALRHGCGNLRSQSWWRGHRTPSRHRGLRKWRRPHAVCGCGRCRGRLVLVASTSTEVVALVGRRRFRWVALDARDGDRSTRSSAVWYPLRPTARTAIARLRAALPAPSCSSSSHSSSACELSRFWSSRTSASGPATLSSIALSPARLRGASWAGSWEESPRPMHQRLGDACPSDDEQRCEQQRSQPLHSRMQHSAIMLSSAPATRLGRQG